ncbi:MAG: hypothetical protein AB1756_08340 [Acidobacteriota bacterium]
MAELFDITIPSARVLSSRYAKKGVFIRLKKNLYLTDQRWRISSRDDLLRIANFIQVPSYISFMTALSFYEITTQVQRNFIESVSPRRSVNFNVKGTVFNYHRMKREYYFDFERRDGLFIATREKAFVDMVYLYSFGKYSIDLGSLDTGRLDRKKLKKIISIFPERTKEAMRRVCKI